jgi:tetratricopeptide (TPR) repeat protein
MNHRNWEQAAADFAAAFAAGEPDDSKVWLDHARVLVLRQDLAGYRRLVPRMIAHCGGNTDADKPELDEARVCVLAPGALADPAEVVRRAQRMVRATRGDRADVLLSLAVAHYRAGQWKPAVARAEQAMARSPESAWLTWPVLAMAHAKLGQKEEARRWMDKAEEWHRKEGRRMDEESAGFAPVEWADFAILRSEAAGLVGGGMR